VTRFTEFRFRHVRLGHSCGT